MQGYRDQNLSPHHKSVCISMSVRIVSWGLTRKIFLTQSDRMFEEGHVGLFKAYRYKRTGQNFIWNYIGNWYVFSKYLDNCCRYQYCANDTLFRIISCTLRSIFQDILPKKDVAFCETTDTAHSYIKQIVNFSEIMCLSMLKMVSLKPVSGF